MTAKTQHRGHLPLFIGGLLLAAALMVWLSYCQDILVYQDAIARGYVAPPNQEFWLAVAATLMRVGFITVVIGLLVATERVPQAIVMGGLLVILTLVTHFDDLRIITVGIA